MGTFGIAFDTIIVGALALPWVFLVIHLFFSNSESGLKKLLDWVTKLNQPAVAGVLLFAIAYSLGSAVSRIAQDFFDDDDLHVRIYDRELHVGVTETSIRTDVYCQTLQRGLATQKVGDPLAEKREKFRQSDPHCNYTGRWLVPQTHDWISDQKDLAGDLFHIQEAALLLKGTDATERLRQFRDQIMVLRGAAFDGLLAFSLCLFWWSAQLRSRLRWLVLVLYATPTVIATYNHFGDRAASDPPYMEFTLVLLVAAGCYVLWQHNPKRDQEHAGTAPTPFNRIKPRAGYLVVAIILTASAFFGWWATQVLYDQQVIYSAKVLSEAPPAK